MIAMALSCNPPLLIADEPTTALDVTIQAQILELMKRLQRDHGSSIVLITHDMGVVADLAERVVRHVRGAEWSRRRRSGSSSATRSTRTPGACSARCHASIGRGSDVSRRSQARPRRLLSPPEGCRFEPRCPHRFDRCATHPQLLERVGPGHRDACHLDPAVRPALRQRSLQAETRRETA